MKKYNWIIKIPDLAFAQKAVEVDQPQIIFKEGKIYWRPIVCKFSCSPTNYTLIIALWKWMETLYFSDTQPEELLKDINVEMYDEQGGLQSWTLLGAFPKVIDFGYCGDENVDKDGNVEILVTLCHNGAILR